MKRALFPAILGVVLFIAFLIAAMPARFVFDLSLKPAGIEAGLVQGRVWNAQILRLRSGDMAIAEASAQLEPASLIRFSPRFDVALSDPALRGRGSVTLSASGLRAEDASGVVRLDRLVPELAFLGSEEVLQIDIDRLQLDGAGRCRAAEGGAMTPALLTLGERYGVDMPVLEFDLLCAGDRVGADLSGVSEAVEFSGRVRFGEQDLEGRVEARTSERDVIAALSFAGFEQLDQTTYALTLPLPEEG